MNKEQQELLDVAYENYTQTKIVKTENGEMHISPQGHYINLSQEEFINKIKTDDEFAKKFGLAIEIRELSREERYNLMPTITGHNKKNIEERKIINNFEGNIPGISYHEEWLDSFSIPTKLITMTYNGETIKSYE